MTQRPVYFGRPIPEIESAVEALSLALTQAILDAPPNSIVTLVVKIDPHGRPAKDTTMDVRKFPLRETEGQIA